MLSWLTGIFSALLSAVKPLLIYCAAFYVGKKSEKSEQQNKQAKADYKALADSINARDNVNDDDDSVHNDPRNRDKS